MTTFDEEDKSSTGGAHEDIAVVYRRYITLVRGQARRILREPQAAEDVAQEVFIRFMEHRGEGGTEQNTVALLYRMTTNLALNRIRDTRRRNWLLRWHFPTPVAGQPQLEDQLTLQTVLANVGREEAIIAIYYYIDGMDQEEIAQLLSMQRRTVGRRLERFQEQAQGILKKLGLGAQP